MEKNDVILLMYRFFRTLYSNATVKTEITKVIYKIVINMMNNFLKNIKYLSLRYDRKITKRRGQ